MSLLPFCILINQTLDFIVLYDKKKEKPNRQEAVVALALTLL